MKRTYVDMECILHIPIFETTHRHNNSNNLCSNTLPKVCLKLRSRTRICFTTQPCLIFLAKLQNDSCTINHNKGVQRLDTLIYLLTKREGLPWHHTARRIVKYVDQRTLALSTVHRSTHVEIRSLALKLVVDLL